MAAAPPSGPAVSLEGAVALAGRYPLLAGCDLEVARGERVLLEGPNGAGKTSLLRVCAGLVALASGRARVLGHDPVRGRRALRRQVGLLGHGAQLYDELTVFENLRFAVRAAGGDAGLVAPAAERWGLVGRLARTTTGRLSAGQRRRVELAALTARWPELWLLDEPHAGLDASARMLLDEVLEEAVATGSTVVVASHEAGAFGSQTFRVVSLSGGRVLADRRSSPHGPEAAEALAAEEAPAAATAAAGPAAMPAGTVAHVA